jgi:integrase
MPKRRGNQEGSIHQREDGRWRAQITLEGRRLSFSAKTRKECADWVKKTQGQIDGGLSYAGASMKFNTFIGIYLTHVKENRRTKTHIQYQDIADRFILPEFGEILLRDLQPLRIENYLNSLRKNGTGDRTTQLVYGIMHAALASALKKGLIGRNPLDAVEKPKVRSPRRKVIMDSTQVQQFLVAAESSRFPALYHLAIATGMREGELLGLRWLDIDWRKNCLKVQQQVQRVPGVGLVFTSPKTEAGIRTIALGQKTIQKLIDHRNRQQEDRLIYGKNWQDSGLVFTSTKGTAIDPQNLIKDFKKTLQAAGLPDMRFHDLRHTSITLLLNEVGAPVKEAQRRAGHTRPSTTMDIYGGEVTSKMDEVVAQGLDDLISPIPVDMAKSEEKAKKAN